METPVLEGRYVRLEPLTENHFPALQAIAFDPSIWKHMIHPMSTPEDLRVWMDAALRAQATGTAMPWVTVCKGQNEQPDEVVGSTRFMDLDLRHRTTELGNTWLAASARGSQVNSEAKLLQLTYAFETLELQRVAFKTHVANKRSQSAIRAIGGVYEGTFRNHYLMPDGSTRDSAWYSIVRKEWPEVKDLLTRRLRSPA